MSKINITKNIIFHGGDIFVQYCTNNDLMCNGGEMKRHRIAITGDDDKDLEKNKLFNNLLKMPLDIHLVYKLNDGTFGDIYTCYINHDLTTYIIKIPKDINYSKHSIFNEVNLNILASMINISPKILSLFYCVGHPVQHNALNFYRCSQYDSTISVDEKAILPPFGIPKYVYVMEYFAGERMGSFIADRVNEEKINELLKMADIFKNQVDLMHKIGIKHNDLHGGNILTTTTRTNELDLKIIDYGEGFKYSITPLGKTQESISDKCTVAIYDYDGRISEEYDIDSYYASTELFKFSDLLMGYLFMLSDVIEEGGINKFSNMFINHIINILNSEIKHLHFGDFIFKRNTLLQIYDLNISYDMFNIYITLIFILTKVHNAKLFNELIDIYIKTYDDLDIQYINNLEVRKLNDDERQSINPDSFKKANIQNLFVLLMDFTYKFNIMWKNIEYLVRGGGMLRTLYIAEAISSDNLKRFGLPTLKNGIRQQKHLKYKHKQKPHLDEHDDSFDYNLYRVFGDKYMRY